jgi:uncharacterized membrane protein YdjX (TVP38/TMEM64 family)
MEAGHRKALLKAALMVATLVLAGWLVRSLGLEEVLSEGWVDAEIKNGGLAGMALFLGVSTVFVAFGLPRQVPAFFGGYAYGFLAGTALALAATAAGCAVTFLYARFLGRGFVASRHAGRIARVDAFLGKNPFTMTLVVRFMPVGSNLLTNLLAGVSSVPALPFLAATAVGHLPQTAIFALLGSGFRVDPLWRVSLSVMLLAASIWLGFMLYRRHRGAALNESV